MTQDLGLASFNRWMDGRRRLVSQALSRVDLPADARVIDVACGDGELSRSVQRCVGGRLVLNDLSRSECAAARLETATVVNGSVTRLPFRDSSADLTLAFEIIEHFPVWQGRAVIAELARITKPGGQLLLSTPSRYSLESIKGMLRYFVDGTVWNSRDDTHKTIYSLRAIERAILPWFVLDAHYGYFLVPEFRHLTTPLTHRITSCRFGLDFHHKLMIVATRRDVKTTLR